MSKKKIHVVKDGRIWFDKSDQSWWFVFEGTFLTALANNEYDDARAIRAAHPQTRLTGEEARTYPKRDN